MSEQKPEKPIEKVAKAAKQAARAESAPAPQRRYRAILFRAALLLMAAAFGILTLLVKAIPSFPIDLKITLAIQMIALPFFNTLMSAVSWPGFPPQTFIIPLLIIGFIAVSGLHWEAVMTAGAAIFSSLINVLVKDLIQRPRPLPAQVKVFAALHSYSFPSGHVMYYIGFFGFLAFLAYSLMKPSYKRSLILFVCGLLIVLIGVSRVYLGQHWPSDVMGSYLLGTLTLVAIVQFYLWGKTRFFVRQPVAAPRRQEVTGD